MDINTLHPHNYEAYQKIMQHFDEGHQRACVVHATGTGKSYIITAVTDRFERVLIVTTNMFVIDQVSDTIKAESPERIIEPVYKIYPALLQDMDNQVDCLHKYDLIVLDEFHHGGAERWGQAVTWILEQNPSAKVLGTSATAIRHSDGGRDMGDELFDGNVVSTLSLGEAWARKVLMAPYYIMAVEDSEEFYNDFIRKIEESNLLEDKKAHYREMAKNVKDNYEMEKNAPDIIRKWLPADTRRIIVFSKDIQEAESNLAKVKKWMKKAGFTIAGIYMIHSKRPFEEKKRQMQLFQADDFVGVKVMVAVDMLNEGIHVPDVDSVFFLRKTQSPTIHLQQMGRCMYRYKENGKRPVVFDFRNNVENTRRAEHTGFFFSDAAKDYDAWKDLEEEDLDTQVVRGQNKTEKVRENFPDGINYTMDYGVMIDRFGEDLSNADWDSKYAEAKTFFDEYGHYPNHKENKRLYGWACQWWRNAYLKNPVLHQEKADMLTTIGYTYQSANEKNDKVWMKCYAEAKAFYEEHGHFPTRKENKRLYGWAWKWWLRNYKFKEKDEKKNKLLSIGFKKDNENKWRTWYINYEKLKKYYTNNPNGNLKKDKPELYNWVGSWVRTYKDKHPEMFELLIEAGFKYKSNEEVFYKNIEKIKALDSKSKEYKILMGWAKRWFKNTYQRNPEKYKEQYILLKQVCFS